MMRAAAVLALVSFAVSCSSSKATAPSAPSGGLTADVDVCGLLPAATVARITGKAFTAAKEDDTKSYRLYACDYTGPNQLRISIVGMNGKAGFKAQIDALKTAGQQVVDVPGIGDGAISSNSEMVRLEVLYGDLTIDVSGWAGLSVEQAKQLVGQLHDKMTAK